MPLYVLYIIYAIQLGKCLRKWYITGNFLFFLLQKKNQQNLTEWNERKVQKKLTVQA